MKRIILSAATLLAVCSCIHEDIGDCLDQSGKGSSEGNKAIPVEFCISCADTSSTRSSISVSETSVTDINLLAYYDGNLETSTFVESPETFTLNLFQNRTYNLYALANIGQVEAPFTEEELLDYKYSVKSISEITKALPMAWNSDDFTVSGNSPKVSIALERLLSKIRFSIDKSSLEDFSVTAVKLKQGSLGVYPFLVQSKASSSSEVGDGDYATTADLTSLNSGGTITFYALENCQGVLLPGNTDSESKVPAEISDKSTLCTYLEMTASFSGEYEGVEVSSDNVVYRFYIGNDNCTDFNLQRNKDLQIHLTVSEDRIFDESWKVSYGADLPTVSYGLELSKSTSSLYVGGSTTLSANYYKLVGETRSSETDVTSYAAWTSSNTNVATVSEGKITAVAAGTCTITATHNGYKVTHTVTVSDKVTYDMILNYSTLSIQEENTVTITARYITYTNGTQSARTIVSSSATWTSSDTSVATVAGGVVTGVSAGTATITAKYNGFTDTCIVTVTAKPITYTYKLSISLTDTPIGVGETTSATATYITYANGAQSSSQDLTSAATWTSSDTSIATVSGGTVTGVKAGTVTITATYNGYSATANVTVEDKITYDFQFTPTSVSVVNGRTSKFTVVRRTFTNGKQTYGEDYSSNFTWTSSNTSVATVSTNGVVTGVGAGTATITAMYSGTTMTGTVTVTPNYTYELVLSSTSLSLDKGSNSTVTATYKTYADGVLESSTNVTGNATWTSTSTSVATVNTQGVVTAVGVGTTTITATYNSKSATCSVKVTGSPTLSMGWTSATLEKGATRTNVALYNPNNGTATTNVTSSATWTTSHTGVATVSGGTITARGAGTCTITATYNGLSTSCTVTVTATEEEEEVETHIYVSSMNLQSVNVSGNTYRLELTINLSDGTKISNAGYTWKVNFAQNSAIATGTTGTGPLTYTGGGSTYTMAINVTTTGYYYDSSGNYKQHTTGTSFSHNVNWTP